MQTDFTPLSAVRPRSVKTHREVGKRVRPTFTPLTVRGPPSVGQDSPGGGKKGRGLEDHVPRATECHAAVDKEFVVVAPAGVTAVRA